jgi:hypothetical protein
MIQQLSLDCLTTHVGESTTRIADDGSCSKPISGVFPKKNGDLSAVFCCIPLAGVVNFASQKFPCFAGS